MKTLHNQPSKRVESCLYLDARTLKSHLNENSHRMTELLEFHNKVLKEKAEACTHCVHCETKTLTENVPETTQKKFTISSSCALSSCVLLAAGIVFDDRKPNRTDAGDVYFDPKHGANAANINAVWTEVEAKSKDVPLNQTDHW